MKKIKIRKTIEFILLLSFPVLYFISLFLPGTAFHLGVLVGFILITVLSYLVYCSQVIGYAGLFVLSGSFLIFANGGLYLSYFPIAIIYLIIGIYGIIRFSAQVFMTKQLQKLSK